MKFVPKIAVVLALALFLAACGGDGGSSSAADQEFVEAILVELDSDPPPPGFDVDTQCMAEAMVSTLGGAEKIEADYGMTAEMLRGGSELEDLNLDEATALRMTDGLWGCGDFNGLLLSSITGEGVSDDDAKCLIDEIGEDSIKQLVASGFMGDGAAAVEEAAGAAVLGAAFAAAAACGITP